MNLMWLLGFLNAIALQKLIIHHKWVTMQSVNICLMICPLLLKVDYFFQFLCLLYMLQEKAKFSCQELTAGVGIWEAKLTFEKAPSFTNPWHVKISRNLRLLSIFHDFTFLSISHWNWSFRLWEMCLLSSDSFRRYWKLFIFCVTVCYFRKKLFLVHGLKIHVSVSMQNL